ncbi:MAG: hypothetical protein FWG12_02055 [Holophagaceae bacterium]|nr:hypothetical protein [Holophagaceae bacterium]
MTTTTLETQQFLAHINDYITTKHIEVSKVQDKIIITPIKNNNSFDRLYGMFQSDIDMADEVIKERIRERAGEQ